MINTWGREKKHFKLWNYCLDKGKKYDERFVSFVLQKIATVSSNRWLTLFSNDIEKKTTETCPFVNSVTKIGEIETQKRDANVKPLKAPGIQESDRKKEAVVYKE